MAAEKPKNPVKEPKKVGSGRVNRGGSRLSVARITRVSYRYGNQPDNRLASIGLRIARTKK